jgi:hypothetical protein
MMKMYTAQYALEQLGMVIVRKDGEYRVSFKLITLQLSNNPVWGNQFPEQTAYYTNDLQDAVDTALYMRSHFEATQ